MKSPAVSVIVPTFNTPVSDFERCVKSLTDQSFDDFEVLIIDDGSNWENAQIIDVLCEADGRLRVVHTSNNGVSAARNLGVKKAAGETICFVDADDYCASWMLEDLWTTYVSSQEIDSVFSYFKMTRSNDYVFSRNASEYSLVKPTTLERKALIGTIFGENEWGFLSCGPCAILLKAELAKNLPYRTDIKYMEDTIWNLQRLERSRCVAVLNETVYAYKMNPYSATHQYKTSVIDERIKALNALSSVVKNTDREWFALRVLANYDICCKCIMWADDETSLIDRLKRAKKLGSHSVWDAFRYGDISKNWGIKEKCKRWLAMSGTLPLLIAIKGA